MAERPYIVGNWKMNGTRSMLSEARAIDRASQRLMKVEVALAPPYTLIHATHKEVEQIGVGAQDCHTGDVGPYTGDVSAAMVQDAGAKFVILGHSERRQNHDESDAKIKEKVSCALATGLRIILCCGESGATRDAGDAEKFVVSQIKASLPDTLENPSEILTIAYEPIWAIGTGRTASVDDIGAMHRAIRALLVDHFGQKNGSAVRILYGGSVNSENALELLGADEVGGALVGGASLSAESFLGIVLAAAELPD